MSKIFAYRKTLRTLSEQQRERYQSEKIIWFFSSIILAIMPFLFVLLSGLLFGFEEITLNKLLGNGELMFVSFTILTPLVVEFFVMNKKNSTNNTFLLLFISNLIITFSALFLYAQMKISTNIKSENIVITSTVFFIIALFYASITKTNLILINIQENEKKEVSDDK